VTESNDRSRVLTLVFTDLADSTALKREKGDDAADALITRHRDHVARLADDCSGRVIDWAGDGCFLTFETSSAAVMFALRLQEAHSEETDLPGVRVGVHMGEVTEKLGHDNLTQIKGLAVDLAARIQSLAKPGQVLLSAAVYDSARQRIGVDALGHPVLWQTHGAYTLKGFDKPLDIGEAGFEGLSPLEAPEASEKAQPLVPIAPPVESLEVELMPEFRSSAARRYVTIALFFAAIVGVTLGTDYIAGLMMNDDAVTPVADEGSIQSIAVLPLDNLMNDPDQDYFADGMTEAITAELAKIKALKVISRTSVMRYKDSELTMPEIAAELGVDGLIEGSVLRDGDEVRITVQLIDGRNDMHVWSQSYTDTITSVLKLQAEIALAIAREIRGTVTPEEEQRLAGVKTVDNEAYDAYLKARELIGFGTEESVSRALEYLKRAQAIDPEMAEAWGAEARAHWVLAIAANWSFREQIENVRIAASRAVALDDTQFYGHVGMGHYAQVHDNDWDTALLHFERAVTLNPSESLARFYLGNVYVLLGDWPKGIEHADEAIRLSPTATYERSLASVIYNSANQSARALAILQESNSADVPRLPWLLSQTYLRLGEPQKAIEQGRLIRNLGVEAVALAQAGQDEEAREVIDRITGRSGITSRELARDTDVATAFVWLGDLDNAFKYIERAYEDLSPWVFGMVRHSYLDYCINDDHWIAFRQDPRYWDVIERLKLPPLPPEHPGYTEEQAWLARKAAAETASAPIEKIAVLPFDNMSSDPEQVYFVDGMTEALIAELAKVHSIKVISRTSVMQYEDTDKSLPEIARELGVDALVEGSVMKANNDVRITAQLVHGITDEHLWAESYTNTLDNVFQVQAEVALTIAREISASLTPEERSRITDRRAIDSDAYDAYLRGRHLWNRRTHADLLRALEYFEEAVAIAPDFALAFAAIADTYSLLAAYEYTPYIETFTKAIEVASRALEIDPLLGEAYVSLGYARSSMGHDFDRASQDFERGIELSPNYEQGYSWYAGLLTVRGETERGRELMETARILDPLSPLVEATMAQIYLFEHNFDEAIQTASRFLEIDADAVVVLWWRGIAELCADRPEEAVKTLEHLVDITNRRPRFMGYLGLAHARLGDREQALSLVREIEEEAVSNATAAYYTGLIHFGLGDLDETYSRLNGSLEEFHFGSLELLACPLWDPLRDDSRFQAILDQVNAYEPEEPI